MLDMAVLIGIMVAAFLLFAGAIACFGVWTYRDAKARGLDSAGLWTVIVVLMPNLLGFLLYFLVGRKQQKIACPVCGSLTEPGKAYCSSCGTRLGETVFAPVEHKSGKRMLFAGLGLIVLGFFLVIGIFVSQVVASPETFTARNMSIGQAQTSMPGRWKLSFWYFDGEKARSIRLKHGGSRTMTIDARIESGTVEAGITAEDGKEERISLNELNGLESPYTWDLSEFPVNAKLTLRIYGEKAKGKFNMKWEQ
ncbi:MAG: hypothetical protein K0Q90_4605 [Paenibacillaceae bacterium]|jgi:hypothetical protein|nr:hypothetical protein [Paenibacillaceae bacterium]